MKKRGQDNTKLSSVLPISSPISIIIKISTEHKEFINHKNCQVNINNFSESNNYTRRSRPGKKVM